MAFTVWPLLVDGGRRRPARRRTRGSPHASFRVSRGRGESGSVGDIYLGARGVSRAIRMSAAARDTDRGARRDYVTADEPT
jgi:hypothetical protein